MTMKIALPSDLHLSVQAMDAPATNADVVVLAGDLQRPAVAIEWARQFRQPTLFIAGNHEFYGGDLATTMRELPCARQLRLLHRQYPRCGQPAWLCAQGCGREQGFRRFADDRPGVSARGIG